MDNLFCCNTYYHLLIAIIKALKNPGSSTLLIFSDKVKSALLSNKKLIERIRASNIFCDIIIFDYSKEEQRYFGKKYYSIYRLFLTKKLARKYRKQFGQYKHVYQFIDNNLLGRIISQGRIRYTLLEDGTDVFIHNFDRLKAKKGIVYYIKQILGFPEFAQSKYIDFIEVNSSKGLYIYGKKIVELRKKDLFSSLSASDKEKILDVFSLSFNPKILNNSILCITQPLSEDNIVKSEEDKIYLYKTICNQYKKKKVFIKTHPREKTKYKNYFKDFEIIEESFPLELINFFPITLDVIVTISSTAVNSVFNSRKKIVLGWNYIDDLLSARDGD